MFQLNKTFVSYENCPLQICIPYTSSQGLDYGDREVKPMTGKKKEAQCRSQLICCRQREWGRLFLWPPQCYILSIFVWCAPHYYDTNTRQKKSSNLTYMTFLGGWGGVGRTKKIERYFWTFPTYEREKSKYGIILQTG